MQRPRSGKRARRKHRVLIVIAATLLIVAAVRAAAPWALERYANARLAAMDRYHGAIDGVDLDLIAGTGVAHGFVLDKRGGAEQVFITAERIDVDLDYAELLRGRAVLDLDVDGCEVNLVLDPDERRRELGARLRWNEFLMNLPFAIRGFTARNGNVFVHGVGETRGTMEFRDIALRLDSLDRRDGNARIVLEALAWDAPLTASGTLEPSLERPAFEFEARLDPLALEYANPWLAGIADLDIEQGTVAADMNAQLRNERLSGVLEARIAAAEFTEDGDREGGPFRKMLEAIADLGVELLETSDGNWTQRMSLDTDVDMPSDPDLKGTLTAIRDAFHAAVRNGKFERVGEASSE